MAKKDKKKTEKKTIKKAVKSVSDKRVKDEICTVTITELKQHPRNARTGDLRKIKESIRTNGWRGVIVVQRSTNYVLAGNHRMIAASQLGYTELPVHYVDIDDTAATRYMLADNKTSDDAGYDDDKRADLLEDLIGGAAEDYYKREALVGTGYGHKEAVVVIARAEWQDEGDVVYETPTADEVPAEKPKKSKTKKLEELSRRSVVLNYPVLRHAEISEALATYRKEINVRTNEEAVAGLLVDAGILDEGYQVFGDKGD